ncbi:MAG: SMC-Scp complex subunit ScpB [Candidatus Bathyarchaeia archaeon]
MQKPQESESKGEGKEVLREKLKRKLALVEAALYVAGRPLSLSDLCSILKTQSKGKAKKIVEMLAREYANRNTAIEILELKDERYVMQLKSEFAPYVKKLIKRPLLSPGPLKTLSYIAIRQPISQKKVIEVRGRHAYTHIKVLKEMGLITIEKRGRSAMLRTTDYFADYFGLSRDITTMKRELKKILERETSEKSQMEDA